MQRVITANSNITQAVRSEEIMSKTIIQNGQMVWFQIQKDQLRHRESRDEYFNNRAQPKNLYGSYNNYEINRNESNRPFKE